MKLTVTDNDSACCSSYGTTCDDKSDSIMYTVVPMQVEFSPDPLYVCEGGTASLTATVTPDSASSQVDFDTAAPSIATVSGSAPNLTVHGISAGTTQVRAKLGDCVCETAEVTVVDVEITNLVTSPYLPGTDDPTDISSMGEDVTVTYEISPSGFTADSAVLEVRDKDGSLVYSDTSIDKSGGTHTATWSVSTTSLRSVNSDKDPYEAKITITKDTTSCYDTESMSVEESTVSIVPEDSPTTSNPITDCMEGRWVTFTATASGFVSTIPGNTIDFTFYYQEADGTPWNETDWSFDLLEDNTAVADDVLDGDADHYFDTPIYVEAEDNFTHSATSSTIYIRVWELWIEYFRDNATGSNWKVVVNKNIAYSAIAAPHAKNFAWDMPEGFPDVWNPTGGNQRTGNAMVIPNSDLPGDSSKFGTPYGQVKVFCEDEEGNNHTFYSTSMSPSRRAEVYFERDATTKTGGPARNWYYYWAMDKSGPCQHKYSGTTSYQGATITWGYNNAIPGTGQTSWSVPTAFTIEVRDITPNARNWNFNSPRVPAVGTFNDSTGNPISFPVNNIQLSFVKVNWEGIDSVEQTLLHEKRHVWHVRSWEVGGSWHTSYGARDTTPPGNDEDSDWLPDAFEDGFGTRWDDDVTFPPPHPPGFYLGGMDCEVDCEDQAGNPSLGGSNDWAYPGKQWH